jgi:proteasome lid subunit RPN8/RPN11
MVEGGDVLIVPEAIVDAMRQAMEAGLPEEACGLLFGRGRTVERAASIENELHSPLRFRLEPRAQLRAMQSAEDDGLELLGIFHSHPKGPAHPSASDMQEAAYPQASYLIWSKTDSGGWQCNLFWLRETEDPSARPTFRKGSLRVVSPDDAIQK